MTARVRQAGFFSRCECIRIFLVFVSLCDCESAPSWFLQQVCVCIYTYIYFLSLCDCESAPSWFLQQVCVCTFIFISFNFLFLLYVTARVRPAGFFSRCVCTFFLFNFLFLLYVTARVRPAGFFSRYRALIEP